jgi:hypothetical protein
MTTVFSSVFRWFQRQSSAGQSLFVILGLFSGVLILSSIARMPHYTKAPAATPTHLLNSLALRHEIDAEQKMQWEQIRSGSKLATAVDSSISGMAAPVLETGRAGEPLIAYAAELGVATKEFSRSRSSMEEILDRHHGYAAKLRMVGQPAASSLSAMLRVPSSEFATTVNDLKALGMVEREEQTADEITQKRADLEARLTNAQHAVARLQEILKQEGKITDLAAVQRQLASLSSEVTRLEAERLAEDHRVIFAQVLFSLREEVTPPVETLAVQFRNAALSGFSELISSVSGIALFVISRGPLLLLWVVLIYFPSRWAWRKWRPAIGTSQAVAQGG